VKRRYRKLPIWVAQVHETVHVKGKVYLNVTTKTGKPRTIRVRT
jgi:hypothetical protein